MKLLLSNSNQVKFSSFEIGPARYLSEERYCATKSDYLSSIPGTDMVEEQTPKFSSDFSIQTVVYIQIYYTHIHKHTKIYILVIFKNLQTF